MNSLRQGWRAAVAAPGLSAVVLLSLAIGIGANALLYAVVDRAMLRPFPFPELDRLVGVGAAYPRLNEPLEFFESLSAPEYLDIKQGVPSLAHVTGFDLGNEHVMVGDAPERIFTAYFWDDPVTALGLAPAAGRGFTRSELDDGARVAMISHALWHSHFGAAPSAIGSVLRISAEPYEIVGVMAPGGTLYDTELWVPMREPAARLARNRRQFNVVARLRDGASLDAANSELAVLARRLEQTYGAELQEYGGFAWTARPWVRIERWPFEGATVAVFGATALLLLLVCANLASLTLSRAGARRREMAIRAALGASRSRLARQVVAEIGLLGAAGLVCGLALAAAGLRGLPALLPASFIPGSAPLSLDWRVLAFTALVAMVAALLVAVIPSITASRADVRHVLADAAGSIATAAGGRRARSALVALEVALAIIVAAAATALSTRVISLLRVDPGFPTANVSTMRVTLPPARYPGDAALAFFDALLSRVRELPGVTSATVAIQHPPSLFTTSRFEIEGAPPAGDGSLPSAFHTVAGPAMLETLQIPLREGRWLRDDAPAEAPSEAVLNEAAAARYFGDKSPIGRRIRVAGPGGDGRWAEVVGLTASVRNRGLASSPQPELFTSLRQAPARRRTQLYLIVRTDPAAAGIIPEIRRAVRAIDPEQPIYGISSIARGYEAGMAQRRTAAGLLAALAAVALALAALGIYAILSHSVSERRREIGVRLALGAPARQVWRMVAVQALWPAAAGALAGSVACLALSRIVSAWLFGVSVDALTLAAVSAAMALVALAAAIVPARRAARTDPLVAMRT